MSTRKEKPSLAEVERGYQLEQLEVARANRDLRPNNAHLHVPSEVWGGRTWVEHILHLHGHRVTEMANRDVKKGGQLGMFGEVQWEEVA